MYDMSQALNPFLKFIALIKLKNTHVQCEVKQRDSPLMDSLKYESIRFGTDNFALAEIIIRSLWNQYY